MADSGKQNPLGVNVTSSLLQNIGFNINPVAASYMGASKTNNSYTFGKLVKDTCLRLITWSINDGYCRGAGVSGALKTLTDTTYNNIISIGLRPLRSLPALGNSKPESYQKYDASNVWCPAPGSTTSMVGADAPATTSYAILGNVDQGQQASWFPYDTTNPNKSITQWGFIRNIALQAWYEYNYNGGLTTNPFAADTTRAIPEYKEFCSSYMACDGYASYANQNIYAISSSKTFLQGTYSNMSDLMTGDISGVNLATKEFGIDLMSLGQALDLSTIKSFGKPSNLLQTLYKNNAVTQEVTLALLAAGIDQVDIDNIGFGIRPKISVEQEKLIYGAFLIIVEQNLKQVCSILNCNTVNLLSLADLLNVQKMFPTSFASLTVPLYNSTASPTNSKTYYPIFKNNGLNSQITSPAVAAQVGTLPTDIFPNITTATTQTDPTKVNLQEDPIGFGSNLVNILPNEIAVAASAFSYSMQQIRNIEKTNIQDFAQVVYSMEGTQLLPLINSGTDVPVNTTLQNQGQGLTQLGSGPKGSLTISDFFGSMSGLPYPWENLYDAILKVQTKKLLNIYNQLFLAVTWDQAEFTIQQNYGYTITSPYVAPTIGSNPPNPYYNTDGSVKSAGSFVVGTLYIIVSLGTTTQFMWNAIAGTSGSTYSVGSQFLCAYNGFLSGDGTARGVVNTNRYVNPSIGPSGGGTNAPSRYVTAGSPELYSWYYEIVITQNKIGGGYGRGTAPTPVVTIFPNNVNARVTVAIGRDDLDAASCGGGTFGRLKSDDTVINNGVRYVWKKNDVQANWNNSILVGQNVATAPAPTTPLNPPRDAAWVAANMPYETISIQAPPIDTLPVTDSGISTSGRNTPGATFDSRGRQTVGTVGWPSPMNSVVQSYIDQANEEILDINLKRQFDQQVFILTESYNTVGRQLFIEQRARFNALPPVPAPIRDPWINTYPTSIYIFTDNVPRYSQNTMPHMHAQTLEAIANLSTVGGQSLVGMMRSERNQARLTEIGLQLDNNLPTDITGISTENATQLLLNGTTPEGIPETGITCAEKNVTYTNPAWQYNTTESGQKIGPTNVFVYDSVNGVMQSAGQNVLGSIGTLCDPGNIIVVGSTIPTGPYTPVVQTLINTNFIPTLVTNNPVVTTPVLGNVTLELQSGNNIFVTVENLNNIVTVVTNTNNPGGGGGESGGGDGTSTLPVRPVTPTGPRTNFNGGTFISTTSKTQGALKTSRTVLRPQLDLTLTRSTFNASPTVDEAIAQVIDCNCDCWLI